MEDHLPDALLAELAYARNFDPDGYTRMIRENQLTQIVIAAFDDGVPVAKAIGVSMSPNEGRRWAAAALLRSAFTPLETLHPALVTT